MPEVLEKKMVSFAVSVWFVPETGQFCIARPSREGCLTTVNDDPRNPRGHPQLFRKLAQLLREAGIATPMQVGELN